MIRRCVQSGYIPTKNMRGKRGKIHTQTYTRRIMEEEDKNEEREERKK